MCVLCIDCIVSRSPSALFIAARVICVFITSQQWDLLFVDLAEISEVCVVTSPTLLASIHGVRPLEDKNDIPSTNCKSLVFVLLMTGLLSKCGVRVWWQRCGLCPHHHPPSQWPVVPRSSTRPHCQHSLAAVVVSCTEAGHLFSLVQWSSISLATLVVCGIYSFGWSLSCDGPVPQ